MRTRHVVALLALLALSCAAPSGRGRHEPLPSWNDCAARSALLDFVERTTTPGSPDFVAPAERIAVFDNDGTLWGEQPMYFQLAFALDRVRELAPQHPEWKTTEPFASVLGGDVQGVLAGGEKAILGLVMASHAGLTEEEFAAAAERWLNTARHPRSGRLYAEMIYQPMVEVLEHLRAHGYKTFIVSGGGIDFLRVFSERAYGIPPEQVVGSSTGASFELRDGRPVVVKQAALDFLDDKAGKPVAIHLHIGRRPVMAFGNSDGDLQMLQYTTVASPRPAFGLLVRHTDGVRETAYDRESHIGKLDQALDEAAGRGWVVVDMAADWKRVFAWQ